MDFRKEVKHDWIRLPYVAIGVDGLDTKSAMPVAWTYNLHTYAYEWGAEHTDVHDVLERERKVLYGGRLDTFRSGAYPLMHPAMSLLREIHALCPPSEKFSVVNEPKEGEWKEIRRRRIPHAVRLLQMSSGVRFELLESVSYGFKDKGVLHLWEEVYPVEIPVQDATLRILLCAALELCRPIVSAIHDYGV